MAQPRRKRGKRFHLELSPAGVFFWGVTGLLILAWIFVLGIFVGRGLLPEDVKTWLRSHGSPSSRSWEEKGPSEKGVGDQLKKDPDFGFYEELATKSNDGVQAPAHPDAKSKPPTRSAAEVSKPEEPGGYTVQVASLENGVRALELSHRLSRLGYAAYTVKVSVNGKLRYRVRCGKFDTREEAVSLYRVLEKKEGLSGFVTRSGE